MPGHIPWKQVELRLRCNRTIWISSTRPDGRPHSVPVWFWWDGRYIYFPAAKDSQKMQNFAHQARRPKDYRAHPSGFWEKFVGHWFQHTPGGLSAPKL